MKMQYLMLVLVCCCGIVRAQVISNFSLTDVVDGNTVSLSYFDSYTGVVIVFVSNECPYDAYYLSRIKVLAESYKSKVPFLLINSHLDEKESAEAMKRHAEQKGISITYLADKDQVVLKLLDARKSPECFVMKNNNGKFTVVYRGAIDDNPQSDKDVNHPFLKEAIDKLLLSQNIAVREERPVGCSIRRY
jgi:hypothetical protein